jgi:hypothetical protein
MTIDEIIAEIDEKYPNGLSSESKVRKMDYLQKRLYRKMRKQTYATYELTTAQPSYPITINIDDIFQVSIGNETTDVFDEYPLKKVNDTSTNCNRYYSFISDISTGDWIDIYPTPTDTEDTMIIWSYEQPSTLTVDSGSPSIDPDYHMLFVYYVCKEIAENYRDFDISNGYGMQYNQLESEFMSTFQDPEVILVHSESGW